MNVGIAGWVGFNAFILALLALDLGVFHRHDSVPGAREAIRWTVAWIALALLFGVYIYLRAGQEIALQYITGYLVEKSLSIDNIFVMVMVFGYFRVPPQYQHRVLFWGILGALVLRGTFIGVGTYAIHHWHWILYGFGALLIFTAVRTAMEDPHDTDLEQNRIVRLARRILPVSAHYDGHYFFTDIGDRLYATPLLLALVIIEFSDVMFAVDSIPAVFAITDDPFIVYTSNVFAILGLRSMYFVLAAFVRRFTYLRYGLSAILLFVGAKMILADTWPIPTHYSLVVISAAVLLSVAASVMLEPEALQAQLRVATPDDAGRIAALHIASWRVTYRSELPVEFLRHLDLQERTELWRTRIATPGAHIQVLEYENTLIGFCASGFTPSADGGLSRTWEIRNLHIDLHHQGEGWGTKLFEASMRQARLLGARELILWVVDTNAPARAFYERKGMRPDGGRQTHDVGGGYSLSEVRYRLPL